jgi:hypothetical protein
MKFAPIFLLLIVHAFGSSAQWSRRKTASPSEKPPKAVLVELFTGYKRLDRTQDSLTKPELQDALKKANQKMMMDFEDNFKYCPVYYLPRTPGPATFKNFKSKKFNVFYKYSNTRTDTHYRACAKRYSHLLQDFYGRYPYKNKTTTR